jgi:hypothetical protein
MMSAPYWLIERREGGKTIGYLQDAWSGWSAVLTTQPSEARRFYSVEDAQRLIDSADFREFMPRPELFVIESHRDCSGPAHAEIDAAGGERTAPPPTPETTRALRKGDRVRHTTLAADGTVLANEEAGQRVTVLFDGYECSDSIWGANLVLLPPCVGCNHPTSEHGALGCMVSTEEEIFCACPIVGPKPAPSAEASESDYYPTKISDRVPDPTPAPTPEPKCASCEAMAAVARTHDAKHDARQQEAWAAIVKASEAFENGHDLLARVHVYTASMNFQRLAYEFAERDKLRAELSEARRLQQAETRNANHLAQELSAARSELERTREGKP